MTDIHVQFESLQTGGQGIRGDYARLRATLGDLERDLQPMIASWSGAARESYLASKQQWDAAALALAQVLDEVGRTVGQAHDNYVEAENSARSNWV